MIDTDKYEGAQKKAWRDAWGKPYFELNEIQRLISENGPDICNNSDVELWADAPLLLQEIKRLREELRIAQSRFVYEIFTYQQEMIDKYGWENFYLDGKRENGFDWDAHDGFSTYGEAVKAIAEINKETPLAIGHIWEWDKDINDYTDNYEVIISTDPAIHRGEKE